MLGGAGTYTYSWTLNGNAAATTATYTVPADAEEGDVIAVTVTDEEGNIATDSVLVAGNLGIEKVETADSRGYYLNVTFTDQMDSLNVADIEIRDSSTKELFTVESATLSSDGYTASIAMKGAATQGQASSALEEGVSYTLKITQNGQTASSTFEVPKVRANAIVENYDKGNKQIEVGPAWSARSARILNDVGVVTLSDEVAETVNYEDLLGRTVTVSLDSANHVTELEPLATQTVVYDFVKVKENGSGKDVVTGHDGKTTYDLETTETTNHSTQDAVVIDLGNRAWGAMDAATRITTTEEEWTYAKIVQNRDGYTQAIVFSDAVTTVWKVDEMSGNSLTCGGSTISLKNYTIVKDGLGITVDDIEEDDIVVVYAADKFAEVYSDSITGVPSAAYADRFTLDGTSYKFANAVFAASDDGQKAVTASKMQDIVDNEASITMYFDRKGDFRFLVVNDEVKSNTVTLIVNKGATGYAVGDKHYINFKAWDGTDSSNVSIIGENLAKVNFEDGTEFKPTSAAPLQYNQSAVVDADWLATAADTYVFGDKDNPTTTGANNEVLSDIAAGDLIKVTYNEDSDATALNLTAGIFVDTGTTNFALGNDTKKTVAAGDAIYDSSKTSVTIANTTYTIAPSTTVYQLSGTATNVTATKSAYSETSGKITENAGTVKQVAYYVDGGKHTVTSIVIYPNELASTTTTVRGVLTDFVLSSDGSKLKSVEFISADGKVVYDGTAAIEGLGAGLTKGEVRDFEIDAEGKVAGFSAAIAAKVDNGVVATMDGAAKLTLADASVYTKASSETPIYAEHTGGGYKIIEPTDIEEDDFVDVYVIGTGATSTNYNVLIKDSDAATVAGALTEMTTKLGALTTACTTLAASTTVTASTANKTAADDAKTAADRAITNWEGVTGLTFATAPSTAALKTAYDADVAKITAYDAALAASPAAPTYTANSGSASPTLGFTATAGWAYTFVLAGDTDKASVAAATGVITFTGNGTVTVSCTAKKDGCVKNITVTGSSITMADFADTKTQTVT